MSKTKVYQQWQGVLISKSDPLDQIKTPIPSYTPAPPTAPEPKAETHPQSDDFSVPDTPPVDPTATNLLGYPTEVTPADLPCDPVIEDAGLCDFLPGQSSPVDDSAADYPDAPDCDGSDQEPADAPVEAPAHAPKTSKKSK